MSRFASVLVAAHRPAAELNASTGHRAAFSRTLLELGQRIEGKERLWPTREDAARHSLEFGRRIVDGEMAGVTLTI